MVLFINRLINVMEMVFILSVIRSATIEVRIKINILIMIGTAAKLANCLSDLAQLNES